eukprot:5273342-Amphidinium_carterae.1
MGTLMCCNTKSTRKSSRRRTKALEFHSAWHDDEDSKFEMPIASCWGRSLSAFPDFTRLSPGPPGRSK